VYTSNLDFPHIVFDGENVFIPGPEQGSRGDSEQLLQNERYITFAWSQLGTENKKWLHAFFSFGKKKLVIYWQRYCNWRGSIATQGQPFLRKFQDNT